MPRAVTLTKVGAAAVTLPGENMYAVLSEHRLREVAAVKTSHEENVARTQMRHQGTDLRLLAAAFTPTAATRPAQHRPVDRKMSATSIANGKPGPGC